MSFLFPLSALSKLTGGKRKADPTPVSPRKRSRNSTTQLRDDSFTRGIHRQFQNNGCHDMSLKTFVGLSAYLYEILRLGYILSTSELDAFFLTYPTFVDLFGIEETNNTRQDVPSFHQWFHLQKLVSTTQPKTILTPEGLRRIGAENPYTFLYTKSCITYLANHSHTNEEDAGLDMVFDDLLNED